ncbi:MAG TPA: hypothetical protein PLW49_00690 [bacterium]|nr:hypothetical protein [bacterium]
MEEQEEVQEETLKELEEKEKPTESESKSDEENVGMAVVAYLFFFIPLLTDSKDDPFVKFHVKQSLLIVCFSLALYILRYIPVIGRAIYVISPLISLAEFAFIIIGIINALNRKKKELPWIGQFAEKWFKF